MLNQIVSWLAANPWVILTSVFITILSLIYAIKTRATKKPRYLITGRNIIHNYRSGIEKLEITSKGVPIPSLTVTQIKIWNKGNKTINRGDITEKDPLTVSISDGFRILGKTIYEKNEANNFKLVEVPDKNYLLVDFEYMDKNDGAVIEIFHTGNSPACIDIGGTIKGGGKIKDDSFVSSWARSSFAKYRTLNEFAKFCIRNERKIDRIVYGILGGLLLFLDFLFIFIYLLAFIIKPEEPIPNSAIVTFFILGFIGYFMVKNSRTNGFDTFYDKF